MLIYVVYLSFYSSLDLFPCVCIKSDFLLLFEQFGDFISVYSGLQGKEIWLRKGDSVWFAADCYFEPTFRIRSLSKFQFVNLQTVGIVLELLHRNVHFRDLSYSYNHQIVDSWRSLFVRKQLKSTRTWLELKKAGDSEDQHELNTWVLILYLICNVQLLDF